MVIHSKLKLQNALSSKNFLNIGYYAISSENIKCNIPDEEKHICFHNQVEYLLDLSLFLMSCNGI